MGNQHSVVTEPEQPTCLICWETINKKQYVMCVQCNIVMHNICTNQLLKNKNYTQCPHCRRVGVLGVF
jgi:hypothetical protein